MFSEVAWSNFINRDEETYRLYYIISLVDLLNKQKKRTKF